MLRHRLLCSPVPVAPLKAPHLLTLSPPPRKVNPDASTSPNRVPGGCGVPGSSALLRPWATKGMRCDEVSRIARERNDERHSGLWGCGNPLVEGQAPMYRNGFSWKRTWHEMTVFGVFQSSSLLKLLCCSLLSFSWFLQLLAWDEASASDLPGAFG